MSRIEMDAMEAQIRTAKTLDKILGILANIASLLAQQSETLEKLVNKKAEPASNGMWYWKKETPAKEEEK